MPGYNGIKYMAEKYAADKPIDVTVELVYDTDTFKPIKKSATNKVEAYEFEINDVFNRGEAVGGFGYIQFADPTKNRLVIMSKKDIEKRKPQYAAADYWGGEKDKWEHGEIVGKEMVEGWKDEMWLKTIKREVYSPKHLPRDPQKVDDAYQHMLAQEAKRAEIEAQMDVDAYANRIPIDIEATPVVEYPEPVPAPEEKEPVAETKKATKKKNAAPEVDTETGEILLSDAEIDAAFDDPCPRPCRKA
jgi:recombination protein RecT